jgi:hypothetical protein
LFKLTAELTSVEAVLGHFAGAEKNDGHIVGESGVKSRIKINIDFAEARAELEEDRRHGVLGFIAKMAAGTGVERDVSRPGQGQTAILGAGKLIARLPATYETLTRKLIQGGAERVAARIQLCAGSESGKVEQIASLPFEEFQEAAREWVHGDRRGRLGLHCAVLLEAAQLGIKNARAIELGNLPDVTQVVKSPFV